MRGNLFIKVFLGFWLITIAVLASWSLAVRYFEDVPEAISEQRKGPPPRHLLRLFYALENEPLRQLPTIAQRMREEHGLDLYLLQRDGSDMLQQSVPPPAMRAAAQISQERRRAVVRTDQGHFIAQALNRGPREQLTAVVRTNPPRPVVAALNANPLLRLIMAVVISGVLCFALSRLLTRRVRDLQSASRRLAQGDLDARINVRDKGGDETDQLARDFNSMAAQLQGRIDSQKRLLQDVSHELRSPLARLRIALALAQEQPETAEKQLGRIEQEAERLDELIGQLLSSQAETITLDAHIDLVPLLGDLARDADFEGKPEGKRVALFTDRDEALVASAGDLLHKCFENILRNALKYTAADTEVTVDLRGTEDGFSICIEDRGPGVPEGELERIFDPLYRVDTVRHRATGGYGLGLAIARRAMEQHGGELQAINTGEGLRVIATLPAESSGEY